MIGTSSSVICPKCSGFPKQSLVAGETFTTHICQDRCGYVFWTLNCCPHCQFPEKTIFHTKPNFGEKITCHNCLSQMYFFRCMEKNCLSLFYKNAQAYTMGDPLSCIQCHNTCKLISCPCGGQIRLDTGRQVIQGYDIFKCRCCQKEFVITICPKCNAPKYHLGRLQMGDRIQCECCKQWRKYVPCPQCGKTLDKHNFNYCEVIECNYCKAKFEYSQCPYGCGINFYLTEKSHGPVRNCPCCNERYYVVNCKKCQNTVYLEEVGISISTTDYCPHCHSIMQFYLCPCGSFNGSGLTCPTQNAFCPKPAHIKDNTAIKEKKEEEDKICKICFDQKPQYINQTCGHLMMCERCLRDYRRSKQNENMPCPVCKTIGRYFKFKIPIYS